MLEGFSGTLVLVDELASGLIWMREAIRRSPHRCLKTLAQPGTTYHGSVCLAVQYASVITTNSQARTPPVPRLPLDVHSKRTRQ